MINLINLKIENFMSIESMELDFPKPGNYIITGYNEIGGDSNGSGKSAILNAIIWGLFGKTARGLSGNEVTRWGSTSPARVALRFNDSPGSILSDYELCRTPEEITFLIAGKAISGHKRDIQQTINETFHTNYDLVLSSIMFCKGQADFLTDSGDVAKKRLFKSLLRLEKIDKMYEKARETYDTLRSIAQTLEFDIKANNDKIGLLKREIESYNTKKEDWETKRVIELESLRKYIESQTPEIDLSFEISLEEKNKLLSSLEIQMEEYAKNIPIIQGELSIVYRDIGQYRALKESLTKELLDSQSLQGTTCIYCGARITKKGMAFHLQEKEQKVIETDNILNELYVKMRILEDSINKVEVLKQEYLKASKEYQNMFTIVSTQRQKIETFEKTKQQTISRIETKEKEENPYMQLCVSKEKEFFSSQSNLEEIKTKFDMIIKSIDVYGYIKWVLSREGVISIIVEKTFNRLETLINNYLSSICTEGFFINIKPQKELKSGAIRDEIDIVITQNGRRIPYSALSGGQEQRVTIASLLAVYKLSKEIGMNRFNFLLLDEVLDLSLAEKGQQDIIRLLEGMENEIRNIFVISHKDNLASEFPLQIAVRRGMDGITRLEGVFQ